MIMERNEILESAERCVCGDRDQQYGSPLTNFEVIARFWDTYIEKKYGLISGAIEAEDVAVMMSLFKIGRITTAEKAKDDSYIDLCGYAACAGEIALKKEILYNGTESNA